MAAKCNSCDNGIMNSEFITGICGENFHKKCVADSKQMLNAVNNSSNIHWYCHDCNEGNRNVSDAINSVNDSIARLASSLSSDLLKFLDGLKLLMDNIIGNLVGAMGNIRPDGQTVVSTQAIPKSNLHENHAIPESIVTLPKEISQSSEAENSAFPEFDYTDVDSLQHSFAPGNHRTKSIVVSNIGKDVSVYCLENYVHSKFVIERERISLKLLLPAGKTWDDMQFLQYKVTIPDDNYKSIMSPESWPKNVHLRDFIYKQRRGTGVSKECFRFHG